MGIELFHADVEEETIRILGKEKGISPRKVNVKIVLWDIDENGQLQRDPKTGEPKTITIHSSDKYIKSIEIEQSAIRYKASAVSIKVKNSRIDQNKAKAKKLRKKRDKKLPT